MKRIGLFSIKVLFIIMMVQVTVLYAGENNSGEILSFDQDLPVIIDTDMNTDDCIAILYLLKKMPSNIKVITISGTCITFPTDGVRNALRLITLGWPWNIPIAAGQSQMISGGRNNTFDYAFRQNASHLFGLSLPNNPFTPRSCKAEDLIIETLNKSKTKMQILSLGALTNIALAIKKVPEIKKKIAAVYIMGGALKTAGNLGFLDKSLNKTAELNIYCDPVAAEDVVSSGVPIVLIPLDICNKVPVNAVFLAELKKEKCTPQSEAVYQILDKAKSDIDAGEYFLWDPLAAIAMGKHDLGSYKIQKINVITEKGENYGRTVIDNENGYPVKVLNSIDTGAVESELINTLNK